MHRLIMGSLMAVLLFAPVTQASAHKGAIDPAAAAKDFLDALGAEQRDRAALAFDDPQRTAFRWTPGRRAGVPLAELSPDAWAELRNLLNLVLSERGQLTVDAILATEAALGVLEGRPQYRDPELYYTAVFGSPGADIWALRFEGHHLSVNLTFQGATAISGTPLVIGANPETLPDGPDQGLRALKEQVDLAWALYDALDEEQRRLASASGGGFDGFLTRPGSLRPPDAPPLGIAWSDLTADQQDGLLALAASYVEILGPGLSAPYLEELIRDEAPSLRFLWQGGDRKGQAYYYRLAGDRLFIEHDAFNGGRHIHAIWRDAGQDWGGKP